MSSLIQDPKGDDEDEQEAEQKVALRLLCSAAALKERLYDYGETEFEQLNNDPVLF